MTLFEKRNPLMLSLVVGISLLASSVVGFGAFGFAESRSIRVVHDTIDSPDIPEQFDGARVVFVTDVHAGRYFGPGQMSGLIRRVNEQNPDILLLGGDNVGGRTNGMSTFFPAAAEFKAKDGKYAVMGNHDYWEGESASREGLAKAGFTVLDNTSVQVEHDGAAIRIAGVEDAWEGTPDLAAAGKDSPEGTFTILLSHNPDIFATAPRDVMSRFDVALAGHTHGGQVSWFGKGAPIVPSKHGQRYRTGWRTEGTTRILVSNGIGAVTVPFRFFVPPQIHVLELKRTAL